MTQRRRASFFAHKAQQHSDIETNNTTARPQQGNSETGIASAPENCTKNDHFSPAKAMTVSIPHEHERAKATPVSGERAAAHGHTKQPGAAGVEGAGGTGGHGRASRRGAERSEAA